MVGGLWMTDSDFKSSIYLKNGVETDPVTVTPILHLSNGAKYILPDVTVKPAGLAIISINDELQKKGISSWATLSGYVELLYTWPWNPFCATIRNVDVTHSLIFTYPLRATAPPSLNLVKPISTPPSHTVEGMWWKHEKNVSGFIAIANLASQPADATVQITNDRGLPISQHRVSVSSRGMKLIKLPELQTAEATHGGVRITSSETSDNLVINGGLEDQTIGYSAGMPFASEPLMQSEPEHVTFAELGLMSGAADPMMLFPAGTTFTPYSILRNVSDALLSITPTLWWMEGGRPHSSPLPQITLPALHTQSLDVASLLALFGPKNFNGSFNIAFETMARRGSLVMSSGSVDQTGTYVFEVGPRGVGESASKSLQQWSTGNGDDTMVTVWNPTDEVQDFIFTLFFEGGHYLLPLHIQPRETRSFDVSEIIQNQVPDAEGNLVPSTVHQGTAKIAGSQAENQHILVALDAGIYNVRKATCSQSCQECDGYNNFYVVDATFSVAVNGTHQESAMAQYHSGLIYNMTSGSNWSSNKTTVATVGTGLVTGKAAGSATITATFSNEPVDAGYICTGGNPCPVSTFQNTGGGSVCGFSITPTTGTAQDCTTGKLNSITFNAIVYPTSCSFNASQSTCTTPTTATGSIDLVNAQSPACNTSIGTPGATVEYYAGPPGQNKSAGTITQGFTLDFNGQFVTKSQTAQIQCP
jgi:Bacterial Ig-like domain (group 2)